MARERSGLSQEAVAERLGRTRVTVSNWERERGSLPSDEDLEALAALYQMSAADLRYSERGMEVWDGGVNYTARAGATRRLPPRVREHVYSYLAKLEPLISEEEVDEVERTMVESTFNKLHVYDPRNRSEDDLIRDVDAAWEFVRYVMRKRGIVV